MYNQIKMLKVYLSELFIYVILGKEETVNPFGLMFTSS